MTQRGTGEGPLPAFTAAPAGAGIAVDALSCAWQAAGRTPPWGAYARCGVGDDVKWGAGQGASAQDASFRAVPAAVNRR
jgi:2-isopropylmalate synthase